jgi:hypothetical protein
MRSPQVIVLPPFLYLLSGIFQGEKPALIQAFFLKRPLNDSIILILFGFNDGLITELVNKTPFRFDKISGNPVRGSRKIHWCR